MKIFCIGLSKTATTSLTHALTMLGFDAVHWRQTRKMMHYTDQGLVINFKKFDRHDAFADTPVARVYPELDQHYPGSKFILTVRDADRWAKSFESQFCRDDLPPFSRRLHLDLYGTPAFDREKCLESFEKHTENAIQYFQGREDDLLIMDITAGDGWEKLCPFLKLPVPAAGFPKKYSKAARKGSLLVRVGRRLMQVLRKPDQIPDKILRRLQDGDDGY